MIRSKSAAALLLLTLAAGAVAAQDVASGARAIVYGVAPPAIDTGVHPSDPPRPPRSYPTDINVGTTGLPYLRGSIVVKFRPGTAPQAQRLIVDRVGASAMDTPSYADFTIVSIDENADPEAAAATIAQQPDVEFAQARYRLHPMFTPNDPLFPSQWNLRTLDMERAWDLNPGASSSIVVAVLDTG